MQVQVGIGILGLAFIVEGYSRLITPYIYSCIYIYIYTYMSVGKYRWA